MHYILSTNGVSIKNIFEIWANPCIEHFKATNWMRLRSDLGSYLDELREKGAHESDLAKLIKSHISDKDQSHQESLEKQKELERMRQVHSQLVASHQKLKNDHQKLIGKRIFSWGWGWPVHG